MSWVRSSGRRVVASAALVSAVLGVSACRPADDVATRPSPEVSVESSPAGASPSAQPVRSVAPAATVQQSADLPIPKGGYVQGFFGTNLPDGEPGADPKHDAGGQWMQDFCNMLRVTSEGPQCRSVWDEAHHENGIYDFATGRFVKKGTDDWNNDTLVDRAGGHWTINDLKYLGGRSVTGPSCTITGPGGFRPNGLGLANDGSIMVADNGPDQQVKLYDRADCHLTATVGDKGGPFGAGHTPGLTGPTRFYGLNGTGMTPDGDVIVGGNAPAAGAWMSRVTMSGKLVWRRYGFVFTTSPGFDPASNGLDAYGTGAHYRLDFGRAKKTDAAGGFPYAFTVDMFAHPHDDDLKVVFNNTYAWPDEVGAEHRGDADYSYQQGVTSMQRIDGHLYKFITGMNGPGMSARRYDGEVSSPMPLNLGPADGSYWGWYVDSAGSIWAVSEDISKPIKRYRLKGVDADGNLQYGTDAVDEYPAPAGAGFTMLERVVYDAAADTLILSGYTKAHPFISGWGAAGTEIHRYDGWLAGKRTHRSGVVLTYTRVAGGSGAGGVTEFDPDKSVTPIAVTAAGKYVVATYASIGPDGHRGESEVFDTDTGDRLIKLGMDPDVRGGDEPTGWFDLRNPTSLVQRDGGECLLGGEDDFFNSFLYWRFAC